MISPSRLDSFNWWTKSRQKGDSDTPTGINDRFLGCEFNVNPGFTSSEQMPAKIMHHVSFTVYDFDQECTMETCTTARKKRRWKTSCKRTTTCIPSTPRSSATSRHASGLVVGYSSVHVSKERRKHDRNPHGHGDENALRILHVCKNLITRLFPAPPSSR